MSIKKEPSKVERAKLGSNFLRGTIQEVLEGEQPSFEHDDLQALKFHGIYQQDDRDVRTERRRAGKEKKYSFMVRAKIPGGVVTADQYLALDRLAETHSESRSLRVTTRQGFQFHGVLKGRLKSTIAEMNEVLISTLAACGDVERNVMASPAPLPGESHRVVRRLAAEIARELCPASRAYHEIWLDGEKVTTDAEPFYGEQYLPRKLKTGIALPEDNSIDVYAQDIGLIAIVEAGQLEGVNLLVGGGLGMTHRKADTFARLATPLGYVPADRAVAAVREVAGIFRDHGNRSDRRHARLKYLVEDWGEERFRAELEERLGFELSAWVDVGPPAYQDLLGAHSQGDDKFFYGLHIANGRILDGDSARLKSALREAVSELRPEVLLTANQNILLADLSADQVTRLEELLAAFGVRPAEKLAPLRRYAMACPALPTCGLALSESERAMPGILAALEEELERLGVGDEPLTVRTTGCPNGCARPYTADIGLVGSGPGHYDIYLGGGLAGDRLADLYAVRVAIGDIVPKLRPVLEAWSRDERRDEGLGNFYQRRFGNGERRTLLTGDKTQPTQPEIEKRLMGQEVA